jgi:hypothetical protein
MGQDTTFAIDDSFSGRIVLAAAAMDTTLKDFIEARQNILGLAREVKRIGMNRRVKKERVTPIQTVLMDFSHLKDVSILCSMGETHREKTEPVWP